MSKVSKVIGSKFPNSKARWWLDKRLESSEAPSFQRFQFDGTFGHKDLREALSPKAYDLVYGDKSLDYHVEKILRGIHENS